MNTAAGLNTGRRAQVQHHVVVGLGPRETVDVVVFKVERMVGKVIAHGGMGNVVQASGPKTDASEANPRHRVQAHLVTSVDLGQ